MSLPLLPFSWWLSGTNENSVPANDNALRSMIFGGSAISDSVSVQPSFTTPDDDGKWYVLPPGATGSQWSAFGADSVAIFYGGNWYEFTPVDGAIIGIDGALYVYDGSSGWTELAGGGGGGADRSAVTALSIASGVVNIDCSLGDFFTLDLTSNVTSITFSNLPASGKAAALGIRIKQDATGGRTVALPASFKATGFSLSAVESAANAYTILHIETFDQGTRWEYTMQAGTA